MTYVDTAPLFDLPPRVSHHLSKSLIMKGIQCPKALWLTKHYPELRPPIEQSRQARFDEGHSVGALARELFPNGRHIDREASTIPHRLKLTKDAIANGETTIYEATFQHNAILIMADILHRTPRGWELYEVKSGTGERASFKHDIAIQTYCIQGAGIPITHSHLIHINSNYTRQGPLNLHDLFSIIDITDKIQEITPNIPSIVATLRDHLKQASEPHIQIGPQCTSPYHCDYISTCWAHMPNPSVFNIHALSLDQKWSMYRKGIKALVDIPEQTKKLTPKQRRQIQIEKSNLPHIERSKIATFIKTLHYPLYFLDFEAFQMAIPPFEGLRPYQQIAFQYSIHYQLTSTSPIQHTAYIAPPNQDPRRLLAEQLIHAIPANSCVVTYNAEFEKLTLSQLAHQFPDLEPALTQIHHNIIDLMTPFKEHWIYYKAMNGSYSIKTVLPALLPELSYDNLTIKDGQGASSAYLQLSQTQDPHIQKTVTQALLDYCYLDTYAMVKILELLRQV
jgi:Domain of unknown function(DUF2779)